MPFSRDLKTALSEFQTASCETKIWDTLSEYLINHSIASVVYHHLPSPGAHDYFRKTSIKRSFDDLSEQTCEIIDFCFEHGHRAQARHMVDVEFWTFSCYKADLQKKWGAELEFPPVEKDFRGAFIPVHGPSGRNGCFALSFLDCCNFTESEHIQKLRWACQNAHQSYCRFLDSEQSNKVSLTEREAEILKWMALGKSNGVIADILDISHHTVNTYVRRIFLKTNTADRTSASLYGISNGLVQL